MTGADRRDDGDRRGDDAGTEVERHAEDGSRDVDRRGDDARDVECHDDASEDPPGGEPATAGGARSGADKTGDRSPLRAAARESGTGRLRAYWGHLTRTERLVTQGVAGFSAIVLGSVAVGVISPTYFLYLIALTGMYILLSMSLNVQWGYTGLINFSVAAFFGVGAYTAGVLASGSSPITGGEGLFAVPLVGVAVGALAGGVLAVAIGVPTLSLRDDYLAIATLGLAEVVRIFVKNQSGITRGTRGLLGMPELVGGVPSAVLDAVFAVGLALGVWLFLRRIHTAPWGRVQRVIRSDEELAAALGKNTFRLRMEAFALGGVIAALAGVVFVHINDTLFPSSLEPIRTFYVWIAVILGGSGSDRGAVVGGIVIVTIVQGTRLFAGAIPIDAGAVRLFLVGSLIILIMTVRQQGVLPPQRELIWPEARRDE